MAQYLHVYMNNPTAGSTDGTEISSNDNTLPLTVTLDASQAESKAVKCAVRCDTGYEIEGDVNVYFEGTNAAKWTAAPDNSYSDASVALASATWSNTIILTDVGATNKIFWVKAASATSEAPQNDRSVKLKVSGLVVASQVDSD